jgi:hypothetical protein
MNKSIYNKIIAAAHSHNIERLIAMHAQLINERLNMDRFFDKFLDNAEKNRIKPSSPEWVTYDKKFAEYEELTSNINTTEYYLEMNNAI